MKKFIKISAVLFALGFISCAEKREKIASIPEVKINLDTSAYEYNLINLEEKHKESLNEIESNLNSITQLRRLIDSENKEGSHKISQKERILREIQLINSLMVQNEVQIEQLKLSSRKNAAKNETLERIIHQMENKLQKENENVLALKEKLTQKDFEIADLTMRIEDLEAEKKSLESVYNDLYKESKTAYIAVGTYRELKNKDIIKREGGILTLGGVSDLNENFSPEYFEVLNIDEKTVIPVEGKKVSLITEHPASSYELKNKDDHTTIIHITNPKEFWKAGKYLVVQKS